MCTGSLVGNLRLWTVQELVSSLRTKAYRLKQEFSQYGYFFVRILSSRVNIIMIKNISKLIDVKSIVTLVLTAVFSVLSLNGKISAEQFQTVFTVVISFYFGTQYQKNRPE